MLDREARLLNLREAYAIDMLQAGRLARRWLYPSILAGTVTLLLSTPTSYVVAQIVGIALAMVSGVCLTISGACGVRAYMAWQDTKACRKALREISNQKTVQLRVVRPPGDVLESR